MLVLLGAALRLWQYAANSSLWIDELALTRNIIGRSFAELLEPLDFAQVAPPGFLLVTKSLAGVFGTGEYALRAFPLFCGLCSLVLFWMVAERVLRGWAVTYAAGLFSLGIPFIYFSAQVKQYSSDIAVALGLLAATLHVWRRGVDRKRAFWLGVSGAALAWFSQPGLFVLAGLGAALLILTLVQRDRSAARALAITWVLWGVSAAAVVARAVEVVPPLDREYFRWFWADGFMPIPPRNLLEAAWLPAKLIWVFGAFEVGMGQTHGGLNYRWSPLFTLVMVAGYVALWRKQRDTALFLLFPVLVTLAMSALSIYPFTARVIAFLLPLLLLATAAGAEYVLAHWPPRLQAFLPLGLALLGGPPLFAVATALPPAWLQHFRPVAEYVARHREPGDRVYVYYGAVPAFSYYAPRVGIPPDGVQTGRCRLANPRDHLRDLDQLRNAPRVWVLGTHTQRSGEWNLLIGYLDRIGRRLDAVTIEGSTGEDVESALAYLYDLSDPARLASASAGTYEPVIEPVTGSWKVWGCYGVIGEPRIPARP